MAAQAQTTADDAPEPRIVRTKRFALRPMDVEEAVMQMELLGHDFFVFRDADSGDVSVVYKRRDGNYGLIESEF
jgi:putative sigma-54 modulation protein